MNILNHIAFIMDGNGRWGVKKKKGRNFGHLQGVKTVEKMVKASLKLRIPIITFYVFSTENWKRPQKEINFLFNLIGKYFNQEIIKSVSDNSLTLDNEDNFMRLLYEETNKLNEILYSNIEILDELGDFYYDQEELIQAKYDTNILDQSTKKIQKNYFILLSILFQILSLLSFLLLFRNFINNTFAK